MRTLATMNGLCALGRKCRDAALVIATWLVTSGAAWGFAPHAAPEPTDSGGYSAYIGPYVVVIICIGVGLLALGSASRRWDRARPEQYRARAQEAPPAEKKG